MEDKFETKAQQEDAINNFKNLLKHAGWQQLVQIIEANVEVVREQILSGTDERGEKIAEEEMATMRVNLRIHEEVKNIPSKFIKDYSANEGEEPDVDPFPTVDSESKPRRK